MEVADIVRAQASRFIENHHRWIHWTHRKVLQAIAHCRIAVLGGHRDQCSRCGYQTISYNSCRNRHCPKCQSGAREKWLAARQNDLLAVPYVHVVFTLPQQLSQLALQNKKVLYDLLFRASAETLLQVARNPKHLGAEIGFLSAQLAARCIAARSRAEKLRRMVKLMFDQRHAEILRLQERLREIAAWQEHLSVD